jgi:hypothetical protein
MSSNVMPIGSCINKKLHIPDGYHRENFYINENWVGRGRGNLENKGLRIRLKLKPTLGNVSHLKPLA